MPDASDIFAANLAALRRTEPELADRLESTAPAALAWQPAKAGPLTATIGHDGRPIWLASRFDPSHEAGRLVGDIDYGKVACVAVLGVGLGYHVQQVAAAIKRQGLLIVFEPDVALLRAVLERIDHTDWLGAPNVVIVDDAIDRSGLMRRVERFANLLTQGTKLIIHPPTRQRQPEAVKAFSQAMTDTLAYCRTNVATVLVNAARTCHNLAANLGRYHAGDTIDDLHGAAKGGVAVCVAAGPSLARNVDLLRDPAVRRRVVLITAQTTLKPLLDRGIRPDFVTALDYAQISQRFYEDLPPLPDVTLVAEPKAHPVILDSFPGPVRVIGNSFNDNLLGKLARQRLGMASGATVAHLSFYLAQFLGCDPIVLIGQDLGFSDGLYYSPGTATHQVWSAELSPMNTVEMMEWQRIVRNRTNLRRSEDVHGQPIFCDEQMITYLKQFERDFAAADQTVIDATEGGMPKAHTERMSLADALARHATTDAPALPAADAELDPQRLAQLLDLLESRVREVHDLKQTSQRTVPLLKQMLEHQRDRERVKTLFARLSKHQKRVAGDLREAFGLVNSLNTIGAFRRARADRAIAMEQGDGYERQARQLERDLDNVDWMMQACDETTRIFHMATARLREQLDADARMARCQ